MTCVRIVGQLSAFCPHEGHLTENTLSYDDGNTKVCVGLSNKTSTEDISTRLCQ